MKPTTIDWPAFLARHDMVYAFYLSTVGEITEGNWRLDLYRASLRGNVTTTRGTIALEHFVHAVDPVIATRIVTTGEESASTWTWEPAIAQSTRRGCPTNQEELAKTRKGYRSEFPTELYEPNPDAELSTAGMTSVCQQKLLPAGEHATAWQVIGAANEQRLLISIAKREKGKTAWVQIQSNAGETCNILPGMSGQLALRRTSGDEEFIRLTEDSPLDIERARGETALIYPQGSAPDLDVAALPAQPGRTHFYG